MHAGRLHHVITNIFHLNKKTFYISATSILNMLLQILRSNVNYIVTCWDPKINFEENVKCFLSTTFRIKFYCLFCLCFAELGI